MDWGQKFPERQSAAPGEIRNELLEFDFGASCFKLFLGFFGRFLGNTFEDIGRGTFDKFFGVCKTEAGSNFTNRFNDGDLVGTSFNDNDVEFGFLFSGFGWACCCGTC